MALPVQTLATGMANPEGDIERLVVQYPAESAGNIGATLLNKLLIRRERSQGDPNAQLYTLLPPVAETSEMAIQRFTGTNAPTNMIRLISREVSHGRRFYQGYDTELYQSMKLPQVSDSVLQSFGSIVEQSLGIPSSIPGAVSEKFPGDGMNDFIRSTFLALAQCAKGFQYEAWNSGDDLESSSLREKLEGLAERFPFTPIDLQSASPDAPPSNVRHRTEDRNLSRNEARLALYKLTLSRLLILLYARESSPATDVRIWELVGQLVALTFKNDLRIQFAIKVGLFVLKGTLDCFIPGGAGDGAPGGGAPGGGAPGGGGGPPVPPNAPGALVPTPSPQFPWRRAATFAGLCTVAVAPVVVLGPLAAVLGFGALGPVAGGIAAGWQGAVGIIEAGSLFAMLQGIGMAGAASAAGAPLLATVSAAAGSGAFMVGRNLITDRGNNGEISDRAFEFAIRVVLLTLG